MAAFLVTGWIVHFYLACLSRREQKAEKKGRDTVASLEGAAGNEKKTDVRRRMGLSRLWKRSAGEVV